MCNLFLLVRHANIFEQRTAGEDDSLFLPQMYHAVSGALFCGCYSEKSPRKVMEIRIIRESSPIDFVHLSEGASESYVDPVETAIGCPMSMTANPIYHIGYIISGPINSPCRIPAV